MQPAHPRSAWPAGGRGWPETGLAARWDPSRIGKTGRIQALIGSSLTLADRRGQNLDETLGMGKDWLGFCWIFAIP